MALAMTIEVRGEGRGKPLRPLSRADMASVLEVLLAGILDNFASQTDLTGEPFGPVTLVRTGALVRSGRIKVARRNKGSVAFATPYARFIQKGTRRMKARPFVGYTLESVNAVTQRAGTVIRRRLQRRKSTDLGLLGASDMALSAEEDALALDGGGFGPLALDGAAGGLAL